jgi:signal transduction histidine kinase
MGMWLLSRRGHSGIVAYLFTLFLGLAATDFAVQWSFGLTAAEMLYALTIVIASVLLSARAGLYITGSVSVIILTVAYAQVHGILHPQTDWLRQQFGMGDAVAYIAVLCIIGLVTWLANKQIDESLDRARTSESALAAERDTLEIKVVERTYDLEQAQLARTMELQRFAEFGRLSAHLLHEVANPLTAASLTVEQLHNNRQPELIAQIGRSLHSLERYVEAARKQLRGQATLVRFSVRDELNQAMTMLSPLARKAAVTVSIDADKSARLYGDPVRFSQLVANLILNAIEAYPESDKSENREVQVKMTEGKNELIISVSDHGRGISSTIQQHLFEPFYTTKMDDLVDEAGEASTALGARRGLGIGLAMVKQFVEEDFGGIISVTSTLKSGTRFIVTLKDRPDPHPNNAPVNKSARKHIEKRD